LQRYSIYRRVSFYPPRPDAAHPSNTLARELIALGQAFFDTWAGKNFVACGAAGHGDKAQRMHSGYGPCGLSAITVEL
jgi:hypothetical protein